MIQSFKCPVTQGLFERNPQPSLGDIQKTALRKLDMIQAATTLGDLRSPPGNKLEKLSGDREGQHSIRINDKYRICFEWREDNLAYNVEIVDYH